MFDHSLWIFYPKMYEADKEFLIDRCQILNRDLLPKMRFANVLNF